LTIRLLNTDTNAIIFDSLLNVLKDFYKNTTEKSKLSETYLNKCRYYLYEKDMYDSAAYYLTNAESLALEVSDYYLLARINWLKNHLHCYERNNIQAKQDVDLQLFYAEKSKNQRQIAYATLNKAVMYKDLDMNDSAKNCLHAALLLSNYIKSSDKAFIYNALGELADEKDSIMAKDNFQKSLEIYPNIAAKLNLAKIYLSENCISKAEALCVENLEYEWAEIKTEFLKILYQCKILKNDHVSAAEIQAKIISEKDSVIRYLNLQNQKLASLQLRNFQSCQTEKSSGLWKITVPFCLIVVFLSLIIIFQREKRISIEKQILSLKAKLDMEKNRNININKNGEKLYNQVLNNEPIASWTTIDMVNFIEYYRMLKPMFVESLDQNYKKLTPRYKIILILEDMGKTIEEIKLIMTFEESSYYSAKSRINSAKK